MPAFAAAVAAHQKRITDAIIKHALEITTQNNVSFLFGILIFFEVLE